METDRVVELYMQSVCVSFQQIMHYYMEHEEYDMVMDTCKRHG